MGLATIAAIAGPAIAGWLGNRGQKNANKANRDEAEKNRAFTERMSNTSWQRGMKDMELAGLNPALAYQQGGAGSPGGSVAARQESETAAGTNSAMAAIKMRAELNLIKSQTAATMATAKKTETERDGIFDQNNILYGTRSKGGRWTPGLFEALQQANLESAQLSLPGLRNEARISSSKTGATAAWISRILNAGSGINPLFRLARGR